jgi:hypothetical protein
VLIISTCSKTGITPGRISRNHRFAVIRNTHRSRISHPQFRLLIASEPNKENRIKRVALVVDHSLSMKSSCDFVSRRLEDSAGSQDSCPTEAARQAPKDEAESAIEEMKVELVS